jgi:hypothetical protein
MSCPRCGGLLAVELAAAMNALILDRAVIEGPHCHCDEVDGSTQACSLPQKKAASEELPNDRLTGERRRYELSCHSDVDWGQ